MGSQEGKDWLLECANKRLARLPKFRFGKAKFKYSIDYETKAINDHELAKTDHELDESLFRKGCLDVVHQLMLIPKKLPKGTDFNGETFSEWLLRKEEEVSREVPSLQELENHQESARRIDRRADTPIPCQGAPKLINRLWIFRSPFSMTQ